VLQLKRSAHVFVGLAVLLTSVTGCSNSKIAKNLEQSLAADQRLKDNPVIFGGKQTGDRQNQQTQSTAQLPADFPKEIPLYPNAQLKEVTAQSNTENRISTRWYSSDPSNLIANYYRNQFQTNNWQILQQSGEDLGDSLEARHNDLLIKVTIQPQSVTNASPNQPQTATEILIEYQRDSTTTAQAKENTNSAPQPSTPETTNNNTTTPPTSAQEFSDLKLVAQPLRKYIQDLAALGVLSAPSNGNKSNDPTTNNFAPDRIITRREYARWLVAVNNAMHANNPSKQIRLASESAQPAFSDVPKTDPDFPIIQGLAEAGLIKSPLSGDSTQVLFRPDAPLTREELILWKIPLDTHRALPAANLEAVKQTWGFQDAAKIDPKALPAVLADFQNGEQSNIRRVFGYTTLFQPKKTVTRAEAAAVLWYFGTASEGISAVDALKLKRSPESTSQPQSNPG
jgi:hypothetical protein